jgi:LPXTG-motif cell wall-anchored protein
MAPNFNSRVILLAALILPGPVAAQVSGQSFQVLPESRRLTVGDTVTLRFRVRLDERDLLFDTVPRPLGSLPPGVRLLSVDKLTRAPDRVFHGRAQLAFYRPGRQPLPVFMLPFMRAVKGVQRATLASDSSFVEISSLLPAGNPPLKDIRELEPNTGASLGTIVAAGVFALLLIAGYAIRRRRALLAARPLLTPMPQQPPPSPYQLALSHLERIGRERWPERGAVARHYEEVVDALRVYLEAAEGVPARERTTEEVLWALPPHLSGDGFRVRFHELLNEADLVKFARLVPHIESAGLFLERSRSLLRDWHGAMARSQVADALR